MSFAHIDNLYKNREIMMFKEIFALEKIHGTSSHITWKHKEKILKFFSGSEKHSKFVKIFDVPLLTKIFSEMFIDSDVKVNGEAYGGKQQGMSATYGKELKFIGFDVRIDEMWLSVPNAENVCQKLNIEFVDYVKIPTDLAAIDAERDRDSVQAVRNGCGEGKLREGTVLRPLLELTKNNGERIIVKHKRKEFIETKTPREVSPEEFAIMTNAREIGEEWVTEMRLTHVLDKLPKGLDVRSTKLVIDAMLEDVYREAKGEIVESKEVTKSICNKAAQLFVKRLKN